MPIIDVSPAGFSIDSRGPIPPLHRRFDPPGSPRNIEGKGSDVTV